MMNKKTTRRALLLSVVSLLLCFTMMLGTTFAWFTDSVSSARNTIKSGNLDVELYYALTAEDAEKDNWTKVTSETDVFGYDLWEPGYTKVVYFKVANEGSLALKYELKADVYAEFPGTNQDDEQFYLSESLKYGTVTSDNLDDVKTRVGAVEKAINDMSESMDISGALESLGLDNGWGQLIGAVTTTLSLEKGESNITAMIITMPTTVGNEANHNGKNIPSIEFGINLFATQFTYESDSFGDDYDEDAPVINSVNGVEYASAAEALAAAKDGDKVTLSNVDFPIVIDKKIELTLVSADITAGDGENAITVNADTTIIFEGINRLYGGSDADGISVAEGVTLNVTGSGTLKTYGNTAKEYEASGNYTSDPTATSLDKKGGSGIGAANATVVIDGLNMLVAEGYGVCGYGVGGIGSSVTIIDTTVASARGGFVNVTGEYNDAKYNKSEPEGGAAIGGETVVITESHIISAIGGSKAAGIGARFWQPTDITIKNTVIDKVVGGASSAAIGGSRIADGEEVDNLGMTTDIVIEDSTITAIGGYFGAGIGTGYNTHCNVPEKAPMNTIYIKGNSVINATGGKYAAGIGTGFHVANIDGEIEETVTVTAVSGEKLYKAEYTQAQDIGFGVVDPTREGLGNTCTFKYNGVEIGIPSIG